MTDTATVSRKWSHAALREPLWSADPATYVEALLHWARARTPRPSDELPGDELSDEARRALRGALERLHPKNACFGLALVATGHAPTAHCSIVGQLTVPDVRVWMCDAPAQLQPAEAKHRATRLVSAIVEHDFALAHAYRDEEKLGAVRPPKRKAVEQAGLACLQLMKSVLLEGLERRQGRCLDDREIRVFLHLAARLARPRSASADNRERWVYVEGWQVCEWCDRVFAARQWNARRCKSCRHLHAPRLHTWHTGSHGDPAVGPLHYFIQCVSCGRKVNQAVASSVVRLCSECRSNAGRQSRHRTRGQARDAQSPP